MANLPADYLDKMQGILDENQRRALLKGDWEAVGAPDNVFNYLKVKAAMDRREDPGLPVEIGVDVARSGEDETDILLREELENHGLQPGPRARPHAHYRRDLEVHCR